MPKSTILFYIILFLLLISRFYIFYSDAKTYKEGEYVKFETQVLSDPKNYAGYQTIYANIDSANKVLIKIKSQNEINYGDRVFVSGSLKDLLLKDGTHILVMNYPKIVHKNEQNPKYLALIYSIRQRIIKLFQENLDPKSSGLLLGIVFGIKTDLPQDFLDQIKITGVTHVIAASGMNVTMVCAFLFYFFSLFLKRQHSIGLSILGIIIYALISGFQASIIRAAIMGIIVFGAQALGRPQQALNSLIITAFVMLFLFPQFLIDVGFQLSFAATLGLLYLPLLFKKVENGLTEDFITTISAQAATLPILLSNFGNYSIFSILANVFVLWTVPILMIIGSMAAITGLIFAPAGRILLLLSIPLLTFFQSVVSFFANFGLTFKFSEIPWQFSAAYYFFLISIVIFKLNKKQQV